MKSTICAFGLFSADNNGAVKQQTVHINGNKSHRLVFVW